MVLRVSTFLQSIAPLTTPMMDFMRFVGLHGFVNIEIDVEYHSLPHVMKSSKSSEGTCQQF